MPISTGPSLATRNTNISREAQFQQSLQLDQLQGILNLFTGNGGPTQGANNQGNLGLLQQLQQNSGQSLLQARDQAVADTQGLTSAALFDFNSSILPQITGAAEGAGASASAITALLAQNAAAASAGQVAKNQGAQILGQEGLAVQSDIANQNNMMQLINTILGQSLRGIGGGGTSSPSVSGGSSSPKLTLPSRNTGGRNFFTGPSGSSSTSGYIRDTQGRG